MLKIRNKYDKICKTRKIENDEQGSGLYVLIIINVCAHICIKKISKYALKFVFTLIKKPVLLQIEFKKNIYLIHTILKKKELNC